MWFGNSTPRYIPKKIEKMYLPKNLHSSVRNRQNVKTFQISINWWMDKHCVYNVYERWDIIWPSKGMKHWRMLQCQWTLKHYAKWKDSDTKLHMVYTSIYTNCPEEVSPHREKAEQWWLGPRGRRDGEWLSVALSPFLRWGSCSISRWCDQCTALWKKTHWITYINRVNFMVCEWWYKKAVMKNPFPPISTLLILEIE